MVGGHPRPKQDAGPEPRSIRSRPVSVDGRFPAPAGRREVVCLTLCIQLQQGDQKNRREDGQDHGFRVAAGLYVEKRQKRDAEPGDEQKAAVGRELMQVALSLIRRPPDKAVPRG